jgi:hypothetical protein
LGFSVSVGSETSLQFGNSGTIASAVFDTGKSGTVWNDLKWIETIPSGTDINFAVRASNTPFTKGSATPAWTPVGGTSPISIGSISGRYLQWRATLTTTDTSKTPTLREVTVTYLG